jgi:sugar/nucleoside kinase (ribokinase family)
VAPGLGVIGNAVLDTIVPFRGKQVDSLGGIVHSLHALAALAPHPSFVVPSLKLGSDAAPFVRSELAALGVDTRFLRPTRAPQNRVELLYTSPTARQETLTGGVPPLGYRELTAFLAEIDVLYLNFISGYELTLPTLRRLRSAFAGPIYADMHSLLLGRTAGGVRFYRPLPRWREWVACFDMVQCNAEEAATLWRGSRSRSGLPDSIARPARLGPGEMEDLSAALLEAGPRMFVLTDGARPVRIWIAGGRAWGLEARAPGVARDPTGCGDVLGAAFCGLHFLAKLPLEIALERAVAAAGYKATRVGTAGLASAMKAWYVQRFA